MTRYILLHEITIKKTAIFLIVNPILCLNTAKTGVLESYDQEICSFIDRNPGRDVIVRSREVHEESCEGCREGVWSGNRQAPPLAYTPCQRFKASCASYADGSLRLLCAPEYRSGFHTADDLSLSDRVNLNPEMTALPKKFRSLRVLHENPIFM